VVANQNGDRCSASAEVLLEKPAPTPNPCKPPKGYCDWNFWKTHPDCWPYCGKTYQIADIIAYLEKLNKFDWFKIACEVWLTRHLNEHKGD
jgi:hypothetical protein